MSVNGKFPCELCDPCLYARTDSDNAQTFVDEDYSMLEDLYHVKLALGTYWYRSQYSCHLLSLSQNGPGAHMPWMLAYSNLGPDVGHWSH